MLPQLLKACRIVADRSVLVVITVGALILLGWMFDSKLIISGFTGQIAMNPLTAITLMLAGLAQYLHRLYLKHPQARLLLVSQVLAWSVALIGVFKILDIWSRGAMPIDRLLFTEKLTALQREFPNRMAPNTAFCFVLLGLVLVLLPNNSHFVRRVIQLIVAIIALTCLLAVIGHTYGVSSFYSFGPYMPMALHTALAFMVLVIGIFCSRPDFEIKQLITGNSTGGIVARRLLPAAVLFPIGLGWLSIQGQKARLFPPEFGLTLLILTTILIFTSLVLWNARLLYRLDFKRKAIEAALEQNEERFRQMAETIEDVFWIKDSVQQRMIYVSPAYEKLWGCSSQSLYQSAQLNLDNIYEADRQRIALAEAEKQAGEYDIEYRIVRPDGTLRWVRTRAYPVRDKAGNVYRIVGIDQDITERKQAEENILSALQKERELGEIKSRFVSMASHQFRTPLTSILSSAEILEHYEHRLSNEKKRTHLNNITNSVKQITWLLNDVILFDNAQKDKVEFKPNRLDIGYLFSKLAEQIRFSDTGSHTLKLIVDENCNLVDWQAYVDEKLLYQVLNNLISNSIKYSPAGSIICVSFTYDQVNLTFKIQDHGMGIATEDLSCLFDAFYRSAQTGSITGTGLGLAIAKKFVEMHGGSIEVVSQEGVGSTFTVKIPLSWSGEKIEYEPAHNFNHRR